MKRKTPYFSCSPHCIKFPTQAVCRCSAH